jgi:hypothetical protein
MQSHWFRIKCVQKNYRSVRLTSAVLKDPNIATEVKVFLLFYIIVKLNSHSDEGA